LAPFLIATGLGSEVQKPLAIVVIFGLFTATVMTKVVVPMLYRYFDPIHDATYVRTPSPGISQPSLIARMWAKLRKTVGTQGT
jgi:cobalt-zinc-cadmium resistance protein CzcA